MANKLGIFLAGGAIGAAIALLYAPRTGSETRAIVAEAANEAWGQAQDFGTQAAVRGQEVYADAVVQGQRAYSQAQDFGQSVYTNVSSASQVAGVRAAAVGKQAYEDAKAGVQAAAKRMQATANQVRPIFSEKNDELRSKIDAARERIAAQVAKNAEAAHASVAESPIAAEGAAEPEKAGELSAQESSETHQETFEQKKEAE